MVKIIDFTDLSVDKLLCDSVIFTQIVGLHGLMKHRSNKRKILTKKKIGFFTLIVGLRGLTKYRLNKRKILTKKIGLNTEKIESTSQSRETYTYMNFGSFDKNRCFSLQRGKEKKGEP